MNISNKNIYRLTNLTLLLINIYNKNNKKSLQKIIIIKSNLNNMLKLMNKIFNADTTNLYPIFHPFSYQHQTSRTSKIKIQYKKTYINKHIKIYLVPRFY